MNLNQWLKFGKNYFLIIELLLLKIIIILILRCWQKALELKVYIVFYNNYRGSLSYGEDFALLLWLRLLARTADNTKAHAAVAARRQDENKVAKPWATSLIHS